MQGVQEPRPPITLFTVKHIAIRFVIKVFVISGIDYKSAVVWEGTAVTANSRCATMLAPKLKQGKISWLNSSENLE